ncbi:peptidoglycan-recognition protein SC2-like [Octopus vulgaris]|uniref:Peptidoglycan-recognition protein SC2-like n=1 Tax=Octopus vulgaris TaxID=6645 RepID=A0AA36BWP9_OCTVU|nr:peptidoglycan-recognition protein SC2-like [Octopus vulgaris]
MTTNSRQFLLPSILLVLAFMANSSDAFTGMCVCARVRTIAAHWTYSLYGIKEYSVVNKGECFKLLYSTSSKVFALQENKQKVIIPRHTLKSMKCPPKQDTVLRHNDLCPSIRNRAEWDARKPKSVTKLRVPVEYFVVHHSETESCSTTASCDKLVKSIQNYHMDNKGWEDIAYNFLIGGNGEVYEGRGWSVEGTHTIGYNSKSIGICLLGNFENEEPTTEAMESLKKMIKCSLNKGQISRNYILAGHKDLQSMRKCPGTTLYNKIKYWPHFIK